MAIVSTNEKPTQRYRLGEVSEGLPGSTKSVACMERNVENLGDPQCSWERVDQVGRHETTVGKPKTFGSRISPKYSETVGPFTCERSSLGEGTDRDTQPTKENLVRTCRAGEARPTSLWGIAKGQRGWSCGSEYL